MSDSEDLDYLRQREAEERAAAEAAACMARTAHEDLADMYAEQAARLIPDLPDDELRAALASLPAGAEPEERTALLDEMRRRGLPA